MCCFSAAVGAEWPMRTATACGACLMAAARRCNRGQGTDACVCGARGKKRGICAVLCTRLQISFVSLHFPMSLQIPVRPSRIPEGRGFFGREHTSQHSSTCCCATHHAAHHAAHHATQQHTVRDTPCNTPCSTPRSPPHSPPRRSAACIAQNGQTPCGSWKPASRHGVPQP